MNDAAKTIDDYMMQYPEKVRHILQSVRETIAQNAPGATEKISYGIPTFWLNGNLIHFAAFRNHIGLYPGAEGVKHFQERMEREGYRVSKGTVRFPINRPIPYDLIRDITIYRYESQRSNK
ncbi:MAG: iron chaperone [Anaerofustis sp.]